MDLRNRVRMWTVFNGRGLEARLHAGDVPLQIARSLFRHHKFFCVNTQKYFFALNIYFDNITPCTGIMWTPRFKTVRYMQYVPAHPSRCVSSYSSFALSTLLLRSNLTTNPESDWRASFGFVDCPNVQSVKGSTYFTGQADSINHFVI